MPTTGTYTVQAGDVENMAEAMAQFPRVYREVVIEAMTDVVIYVTGEVQKLTPVNTGFLRGSIGGRVEALGSIGTLGGEITGIVDSPIEYALDVEVGLPPGTWIDDIESLKRWAHLVLGDENAAYAVRAAIYRRGTRIHPHGQRGYWMFARGWLAAKPGVNKTFSLMPNRIVRRVTQLYA